MRIRKRWVAVALAVGFIGTLFWVSDKITLQGERTIYTVNCQDGAWAGNRCTGRMVAGERHSYRSSRSRNEVIYWVVGSSAPSGKYADCVVKDRGNWKCNVRAGQPAGITSEMTNDRPVCPGNGSNPTFHAVSKFQWWVLRAGIPAFSTADFQITGPA